MTWYCHVYESSESTYKMILSIDLLQPLVSNLKLPKIIIEGGDRSFKRCTVLMVNLGTYYFKILNHYYVTSEESFTDAYVEEVFGSKK